jgi:hypothetical protein
MSITSDLARIAYIPMYPDEYHVDPSFLPPKFLEPGAKGAAKGWDKGWGTSAAFFCGQEIHRLCRKTKCRSKMGSGTYQLVRSFLGCALE